MNPINSIVQEEELLATYSRRVLLNSIRERLVVVKEAYNSQCNQDPFFRNEENPTGLKKRASAKVIGSIPRVDVYLELLAKNGDLVDEVLISGQILLEKYLKSLRMLCPINFHKLVAVSCYVAQKVVLDTEIWSLSDFGTICGLSHEKLKSLEIEFIKELDFKVHIGGEEYSLYKESFQ